MRSQRRVAAVLLLGYVLLVGCIVFWPESNLNDKAIEGATHAFARLAGPGVLSDNAVEFAANVLLFVPLTFLGSVIVPGWWRWVLIAVGLTISIEVLQLLLLPARTGRVSDVLANSIGGVLGASVALLVVRRQ